MQVIAEGVEDEDQMQLLRELKCDCIQGFLLSRPSPPEEIKVFLVTRSGGDGAAILNEAS
jgi:EAL domain-containing protein (putative c-di-GMP-specific phosphodiesterase class I)